MTRRKRKSAGPATSELPPPVEALPEDGGVPSFAPESPPEPEATEPVEAPPAPEVAEATPTEYKVAPKRAINCARGVLGPGAPVRDADFPDGRARILELAAAGYVVPR